MSESRRVLGVVMDPSESIKPKKDSSLAMLLAAQRAGWSLLYFRQQDLSVRNGAPWGHGSWITVRDDGERWFEIGKPWIGGLEQMDALLMRKDPPFDMEYVYSSYLLELAQEQGARVFNHPRAIRDCNEKMTIARFLRSTMFSIFLLFGLVAVSTTALCVYTVDKQLSSQYVANSSAIAQTIRLWPREDEVEIAFIDTGHGMNSEMCDQIFEPYFSTKETGIGLGLPLTRKIIEEHGGEMSFAGANDGGTQVTMRFARDPLNSGRDSEAAE